MENYILRYFDKIDKGEVKVCKKLKMQYEKIINRIDNGYKQWRFDLKRASSPILFIEKFCRHSKGKWAGQPVELELYQKAKLQSVYGFIDDNGIRQYRETFTMIARKNGKSTEKAATGLYMLVADNEPGSEIYSVATMREQARIVFDESLNMTKQSIFLSRHIKKRKTDLFFIPTLSSFAPLSSKSNTLDGKNPHNVIIDELHAIKDRNLYDVMKQGMSTRRQPLIDMITTAGFIRDTIFDSIYDLATRIVLDESEDDRFIPFFYELDKTEEWLDETCWEKANPTLGKVKSIDTLREYVERAHNDPPFRNTVLTKDFNVLGSEADRCLSWEELNNTSTFDHDEISNRYACGGVDLSSTTDLTCATLLVAKSKEELYVLQHYFLPLENIQDKEKVDGVPYSIWAEKGLLTLCEGNKVDYSKVTEWFLFMANKYKIIPAWIGYDQYNAAYWINEMKSAGFNLEVVKQTTLELNQPTRELIADVCAKRINYNNNPILKWCLSNVTLHEDTNGNIRFKKTRHQRRRIDGASALADAYAMLIKHYDEYKSISRW